MTSVLGKLICKELGKDKYHTYITYLKEKQSMEVFCDIYSELRGRDENTQALMLLRLLETVQLSVRISRHFYFMVIFYVAVMATLFFLLPSNVILMISMLICTFCIIYKFVEFMINRYCDKDIRMILIYKSVLFHLLEDTKTKKGIV